MRVEGGDCRGQRRAEHVGGRCERGLDLGFGRRRDECGDRADVAAADPVHERASRAVRGQAAGASARAPRHGAWQRGRDLHMADGAREAVRPTQRLSPDDDAAPDARRDLQVDERLVLGPRLAHRARPRVVLHRQRHGEPGRHGLDERIGGPARHGRGVQEATGRGVDGGRHAEPDPHQPLAAPRRDQLLGVVEHGTEDGGGTIGDGDRQLGAALFAAEQIGDGDPGVGLAEVHDEDDPPPVLEPDAPRPPPAGGPQRLGLVHQAEPRERVQPAVERAAGHAGLGDQLLPRQALAVAHELHQLAVAGDPPLGDVAHRSSLVA